jgi:hypothetical protein
MVAMGEDEDDDEDDDDSDYIGNNKIGIPERGRA